MKRPFRLENLFCAVPASLDDSGYSQQVAEHCGEKRVPEPVKILVYPVYHLHAYECTIVIIDSQGFLYYYQLGVVAKQFQQYSLASSCYSRYRQSYQQECNNLKAKLIGNMIPFQLLFLPLFSRTTSCNAMYSILDVYCSTTTDDLPNVLRFLVPPLLSSSLTKSATIS